MKLYIKWIFILGTLWLVVNNLSCTFDSEEDLLKEFACDTTNIYYDDLTYIFTNICSNCHNSTFTYRDFINMDSYDNVVSSINTGYVWRAINHEEGVRPMPNGLPKLSDCEISKIGAWINAGMPEKSK